MTLPTIILGCLLAAALVLLLLERRKVTNLQKEAHYDAETIRFLKEQVKPFDRDGDGKIGGSVRGVAQSRPKR